MMLSKMPQTRLHFRKSLHPVLSFINVLIFNFFLFLLYRLFTATNSWRLFSIPTVSKFKDLFEFYDGPNGNFPTPKNGIVDAFIDEIVKTPVMIEALEWLEKNSGVHKNRKELLKHSWFTDENGSNGFRRVFLAQNPINSQEFPLSMNNWIYLAYHESTNGFNHNNFNSQSKFNYLGFLDSMSLSGVSIRKVPNKQ